MTLARRFGFSAVGGLDPDASAFSTFKMEAALCADSACGDNAGRARNSADRFILGALMSAFDIARLDSQSAVRLKWMGAQDCVFSELFPQLDELDWRQPHRVGHASWMEAWRVPQSAIVMIWSASGRKME